MHILIPAMLCISYISLLLLLTPATVTGLVLTVLLSVLGLALMIRKKPQVNTQLISKLFLLTSILVLTLLGLRFYHRWLSLPEFCLFASELHLFPRALAATTSVYLACCATICTYMLFQQIQSFLGTLRARHPFLRNILLFLLFSMVTVSLTQEMIGVNTLSMGVVKFIWGTLIILVTVLALYCLLKRPGISTVLGTGIFMLISTVNVYVYNFRARLFEPIDILSIGTAANVASNYSFFPVPFRVILAWSLWVCLLLCVFDMRLKDPYIVSGKGRVSLLLCCLIGAVSISCYTADLKTYHWHESGALYNGFVLDFVSKFKEAHITKPDGYSETTIDQLSEKYASNTDLALQRDDLPHIIVIMDESFSDLSVLGEISTNKEVTPFISSLRQDAISGYALSSVYGGNTANSEYEFLTGNSMAWLPFNSVPYQQYMKGPAYSMVSYLKSQYDYQCIAMHPYLSDGWERPSAYSRLGFDEVYFIDDFPRKQYIREYVSDQSMFETMISTYEEHRDEPLFLFGVSMQNHGGYTYDGKKFTQSISLVGYDDNYPRVEQYLSLIHETDKAVEYLISYFENVSDDVIIVFFGDHHPKLNEEFYAEVAANDEEPDSLDKQQRQYTVPFFIWANYDIEEKYMPCSSLNYLSSYVYEVAGISLPPYNQFLSDLEERIPAINASGFYSSVSQRCLPFDMASEEEQFWLQLYDQLQYNNVFDDENRSDLFFPTLKH